MMKDQPSSITTSPTTISKYPNSSQDAESGLAEDQKLDMSLVSAIEAGGTVKHRAKHSFSPNSVATLWGSYS